MRGKDQNLQPVLNLLNYVIYDFKKRNPSIGEPDVLLSLRRLRLFLKRKDLVLTALENELFDGVVGISSLAGCGRAQVMEAIDYLERIVGDCTRTGRSYFDSLTRANYLSPDVKGNN